MKNSMKVVLFLSLMCGAFGADEDEVKSVEEMEGDSVTLNPDPTKIREFNKIQWSFENAVIAQARKTQKSSYENNEKFIDRLELDNQNGSLTIKNMRTKHSGLYNLQIDNSRGTLNIKFHVRVYESPLEDAYNLQIKNKSVNEGESVTLCVPQLYGDELIVWRFGDAGKRIAKADMEAKSSLLYETDETFKDRLQLENKTGSLIITNTRTTDSGHYTVKISSNNQTLYKRFTVIVSDPGLSPGAAAGIVVVGLLVAAAVAGVIYYCCRITNLPTKMWSKFPGDNVTLNPETEIQTSDEIQWLFGAEDTLIAEIKKGTSEMIIYDGPGEIFKNRLKLNKTTGSLTIECINTEHTGLYTLKIRRCIKTLKKRFQVSVYVRYEAVFVGDSVRLLTGLTEIKKDEGVQWLVKDKKQEIPIAEIKGGIPNTYDGPGIFKDSLELDTQTGDLNIKYSSYGHAGCYKLKIRSSKGDINRTYFVIIRGDSIMDIDPRDLGMEEEETGRQVNESATVVMPLLNGEDLADDQEGTSSL